ncbi:MAG: methyltransferase domain-containing protein [Limisphaerales bacterium]
MRRFVESSAFMDDFYDQTLTKLVQRGILDPGMRILVTCGGTADRDVFFRLGFKNVTISNVDSRMKGDEFAPFAWSYQDAENLQFPDGDFDFVVAHSGLHHCYSPHRALLEMYRVARRAILIFEPRDSFLVRLGVRLSFGQEYEVAAVVGNSLKFGGVRNTPIPNYVYRWTEREIEKTLATYGPLGRPRVHYFYALRVPEGRLAALKNRLISATVRAVLPLLKVFTAVFPKQTNCFAFCAEKLELPRDLHPWLEYAEGQPAIRRAWIEARYRDFTVKDGSTKP